MIYREYRPAPPLTRTVECYWALRGVPSGARGHRVLPDGCMDLVFRLEPGDPSDHEAADAESPYVVGAMPRAVVVPQQGEVHVWGVRFRPGAATPFLGIPAHRLTARSPELDHFWGAAARELGERLGEAPDDAQRVAVLDRELLGRLKPGDADEIALAARRILEERGGNVEIGELARMAGLSTRQLQRRFARSVGLSPKLLARILRFRRAARTLAQEPDLERGRLALRLGYYDQAHFCRDFRELAGVAPGGYLKERRDVAFVQANASHGPEVGFS